ncbi:MAG: tetratricopeptide repeat protein [bacterium]
MKPDCGIMSVQKNHRRRVILLICLFLIILTYVSFSRILKNGFINFDDIEYVVKNPRVNSGITFEGIKWAFTKFHFYNWHPLTWISHMADYEIYGLNAGGHHLTSLLLHILNTLLLFIVLKWITGSVWRSAFIAFLFAVHPLHVESVAWVSERKDVLSTLFWILTIWAYAYYAENKGINRYLLTLFCFAFGLMAKPMLVTLPFVLLLLDYWPLRRIKFLYSGDERNPQTDKDFDRDFKKASFSNLVLEKIPFLTLSIITCFLTFFAQKYGGAVKSLDLFPLNLRIANALVSYLNYIIKMFLPINLAILYPYSEILPIWRVLTAGFLLIGSFIIVIRKSGRYPYLLTGWLWYIGTLIPVIGLVQVGLQSMADRYTYIPMIGLFIIIIWGISDIIQVFFIGRNTVAGFSILIIAILITSTWLQTGYWFDTETLLEHTIKVTDRNYLAYNGLGVALIEQGRTKEGIDNLYKALQIKHDYAEAHKNLGIALVNQGKLDEAISHYEEALSTSPDSEILHNSIGIALFKKGAIENSIAHFSEAVRIWPGYVRAHNNLGIALSSQGNIQDAILHYKNALKIKPDYAEAHFNMGIALEKLGRNEEAIIHYTEAIKIKPDYDRARYNLRNLNYGSKT